MQEIILKEKNRKEIIDGKIYDTETATKIAFRCNICSAYNAFLEILYRKKNGQFFLYTTGEINAYIAPLANEEAKKWCEEYASADTYQELFGKVTE